MVTRAMSPSEQNMSSKLYFNRVMLLRNMALDIILFTAVELGKFLRHTVDCMNSITPESLQDKWDHYD